MDPRREAFDRLDGAYEVRVLEPSPPAVADEPYADDPVARGEVPDGRVVVSPVTTGDLTWDELTRREPSLAGWCADRWLGAWRPLPPIADPAGFVTTRSAWHALAEHVLSPARHEATGKIGLRRTRGGVGTPFFGHDEQIRIEGGTIVCVQDGREVRREPITTLAAAAAIAGRPLGAGTGVYEPTTALEPAAPLVTDAAAHEVLAAWFGFGTAVLEQLRAEAGAGDDPTLVQLWPEHFDLAVELGDADAGGRGTFGASPGDEEHPEPYLYVTHWADVPDDEYWNDHAFTGASLPWSDLTSADDPRERALAFLRHGRAVLTGP